MHKRHPIQKRIIRNVKNDMKMFEFLKLKAKQNNIIVIQVLDRVYNVPYPSEILLKVMLSTIALIPCSILSSDWLEIV